MVMVSHALTHSAIFETCRQYFRHEKDIDEYFDIFWTNDTNDALQGKDVPETLKDLHREEYY